MKRVLFVDDEPHILQGLQRLLRSMRDEWEVAFADGGQEALNLMSQQDFDVIVTDMRMPGMDGAQLLQEVSQRHPQIVRIILSGHSEHEVVMKSVGPAHQYIAKPCSAELLKETVGRACALRDILNNPSLQKLTAQMQSLPSLPSLYSELVKEMYSSNASMVRAGEIIARDMGMTAKILQIVNSAFFGLRRRITNSTEAVMMLGWETVVSLMLSVQVFSQFNNSKVPGFSQEKLWSHSMAVGNLAKKIVKYEAQAGQMLEDTFTSGLLHDSGKVVLVSSLPEKYVEAMTLAKQENLTMEDAENAIFGATHAEVGAFLLGLWGLPDSIVEAVAFHHRPHLCVANSFSPLTAVHVANAMLSTSGGEPMAPASLTLDMDYIARLKLSDHLPAWQLLLEQQLQAAPAA